MSKQEFLDELRRNLSGELPIEEVESNIRFYAEYISSPTQEEENRKIEEVGEPRLIARNIVETYQMAHPMSKNKENGQYRKQYEEIYESEDRRNSSTREARRTSFRYKLTGIISFVFVLAFIIVLLKALSFALRLFLPILLVLVVIFIISGIIHR